MESSLDLGGVWKLRGSDGQHGQPEAFCGAVADERTFIDGLVPGDVHLDLEREGWIADCTVETNALAARWVEEHVWVYRRTFQCPSEAVEARKRAWLVFDGLDLVASVYLNGQEIANHNNVYVPLRVEVTGRLIPGENVLAVRIESGLYSVSDKDGEGYSNLLDHRLHKRSWLRKPQCQFSWDWSPRLINVGIWRPVRLEWADVPRIDSICITCSLSEDHAHAALSAAVRIDSADAEHAVLRVKVPERNAMARVEVDLPAGISNHTVSVAIADPELWWPRGHGGQKLYDLEVELEIGGKIVGRATRRTGIRSVRITQDPHPKGGKHFILEVNGRPIFAKGGNWVPPDILFARITPEHVRRLVELAAQANFNTLRIWGGGLYADESLLDACDELGLLVWHDFIFACSKYPGDDPGFLNNVRAEVEHIVRDLSAHPSLAVWCGNNELEWGGWEWGYDQTKAYPDYALFHLDIPRILKREDPSRPYWPSSPYSEDSINPNDPTTGDQHPWSVTLREDGPNFWAYRNDVSRFPNEGGVLGAALPATVRQFLPESQQRLFSPGWEFHDNAVNYWSPGGIAYRIFQHWLGKNAAAVELEDYLFYSGLLQAEGLQEYIHNFRRRKFSSSAAIFWMYNDCWPASHSWTIVDYYLRRRMAYHPVRRAFADAHVILAQEGETVIVTGVNDTPERLEFSLRWGIFGLGGGLPLDRTRSVALEPNSAAVLAEIPLSEWRGIGLTQSGAFACLSHGDELAAQNRLFLEPFKSLQLAVPDIRVHRRGGKAVFSSPVFAWGVTLDLDGEQGLADDVFDLLPGIEYTVAWPQESSLPAVQRCGSDFGWAK